MLAFFILSVVKSAPGFKPGIPINGVCSLPGCSMFKQSYVFPSSFKLAATAITVKSPFLNTGSPGVLFANCAPITTNKYFA